MEADEKPASDASARKPASAGLATLALVVSLLVLFIGLISNMGSAPGSDRAFLVEKLGLVGGLVLLILSVLAFVAPFLRRIVAMLALATLAGLLILSW